jgi:hypothetical protein
MFGARIWRINFQFIVAEILAVWEFGPVLYNVPLTTKVLSYWIARVRDEYIHPALLSYCQMHTCILNGDVAQC